MIDFSRNHFELFGLPERFRFDPAIARPRLPRAAERGASRPPRGGDRRRSSGSRCSRRRASTRRTARSRIRWRARSTCCRCTASTRSPRTRRRCRSIFSSGSSSGARPPARRGGARRAGAGALLAEVRAESAGLEQRVAALLDADAAWDAARARVRELRFLAKLAADIDEMLAELDD